MITGRPLSTAFACVVLAAAVSTSPALANRAGDTNAGPYAGHSYKSQKGANRHAGGPNEKAKSKPAKRAWRDEPNAWMDRDGSVVVVRRYYGARGLPPGLAKKQALPPGLQKQLYERGHLPPGLEKHWVVLPVALERELPPLPPHHVRRIVGNDLLVVDLRANLIVSLWPGVFGR